MVQFYSDSQFLSLGWKSSCLVRLLVIFPVRWRKCSSWTWDAGAVIAPLLHIRVWWFWIQGQGALPNSVFYPFYPLWKGSVGLSWAYSFSLTNHTCHPDQSNHHWPTCVSWLDSLCCQLWLCMYEEMHKGCHLYVVHPRQIYCVSIWN